MLAIITKSYHAGAFIMLGNFHACNTIFAAHPPLLYAGMRKLNVFISYSHVDEAFKTTLDKHLTMLKRSDKIATWNDRALLPAQDWDVEIKAQLDQADIILLLVSNSFLASDYIWQEELSRAKARHDAGAAKMVPIFIKACDWEGAPFGALQGLPANAQPVDTIENDHAWTEIARGIRRLVDNYTPPVSYSMPTPPIFRPTTQEILTWPVKDCLRPTCTQVVLNELLVRGQSVNLTGDYGHGKSRLLQDLRDMATEQGLAVALLDLKEHRLQYANFLRSMALQLSLERSDYAHFEDLTEALSRRRDQRCLLLIDNLETLNEYQSNDPRYDARFVSSLNLLKDLTHTHLLCASRSWLKSVVFGGETSLLTLHRMDLTPLSETEIQTELRRRLKYHPFLQQPAHLQAARIRVQAAGRPYILLEELIRRIQAQYVPEKFETLLNELGHG
ncbi:MAG: TIR domain-containing protein [Saprospiraceae bacterium]|nr:TIR domain-containing protein [Saprospiraceae bacterium]